MKLVKYEFIETIEDQKTFLKIEVTKSDDINFLKALSNDLCREMAVKPSMWTTKYPIIANKMVEPTTEWIMSLTNGTVFSIEN